MKLHSAVFYSTNLQLLKELYADFLGAEIESERDDKFISFKFENGFRLGIKVGDKPREVGGMGLYLSRFRISRNGIKRLWILIGKYTNI